MAQIHVAGADAVSAFILADAFGATPVFGLRRATGTAAAPSAVAANTPLGQMAWYGYRATGYSGARATIQGQTAEAWTDTAQRCGLRFRVTAPGTTSVATRMDLTGAGSLLLNGAVDDGVNQVQVAGTVKVDQGFIHVESNDGNSGTAKTLGFSAAQNHKLTLTGNCTLSFTAPNGPCLLMLSLIQAAPARAP